MFYKAFGDFIAVYSIQDTSGTREKIPSKNSFYCKRQPFRHVHSRSLSKKRLTKIVFFKFSSSQLKKIIKGNSFLFMSVVYK